jgi:Holliday junction resolvase-like predicted endonuclease
VSIAKYHFIGLLGELVAISYYAISGYVPIRWRLRLGGQEVDLVLRKGRRVIFVEVKTSVREGRVAETAFNAEKLKNLQKALRSYGRAYSSLELELFCLNLSGGFPSIRRYPQVCLWLG